MIYLHFLFLQSVRADASTQAYAPKSPDRFDEKERLRPPITRIVNFAVATAMPKGEVCGVEYDGSGAFECVSMHR